LAVRLLPLCALPAGRLVGAVEGVDLVKPSGRTPAIAITAIGGTGVLDLDGIRRQLIEEARGQGGLPETVNAPVLRQADTGTLARACNADIGEAPFLLEPGAAEFVHGALGGE